MGEDLEGIAASSGSENNGLGSGEERDVGICTQEDRRHTAGEVGEAEEGGVDSYDKPRDRDGWAVFTHAVLMLTYK